MRIRQPVRVAIVAGVLMMSVTGAPAQSPEPIASSAPEPPPVAVAETLLQSGRELILRVRQVIPCDGLAPGDRLLNGRPALQKGDRILAEVVAPGPAVVLVGGTVENIAPPRHFSKPGRITLRLGQLVTAPDGRTGMAPWIFDLEDRRLSVQRRRYLLLALFAVEGLGVGASIGSQFAANNPAVVGGSAGVGLLSGIGYAGLIRGQEATLEPGDMFRVQVGTLCYQPIPQSPPLKLFPAPIHHGRIGSIIREGPIADSRGHSAALASLHVCLVAGLLAVAFTHRSRRTSRRIAPGLHTRSH